MDILKTTAFAIVFFVAASGLGCASQMTKVNAALDNAQQVVHDACDEYEAYVALQASLVTAIAADAQPIEDTAVRIARDLCVGARAINTEPVTEPVTEPAAEPVTDVPSEV